MSAAAEARDAFTDGRNCAESLLLALSERPGVPPLPDGIGAGFTSGIGKTGCVCGALAGGVMVLSASVESSALEPVARREEAERLAAEFTRRFTAEWGATCCRSLKRGMVEGSDASLEHCARITEFAASTVAEILATPAARPRARATRDLINATRRSALDVLAGGAVGLATSLVLPIGQATGLLLVGLVVGSTLGIAEWRGRDSQRVGRGLRALGLLSTSLTLSALAFAPAGAAERLSVLAAPDVPNALARVMVAAASLAVAFVAAYDFKRFR